MMTTTFYNQLTETKYIKPIINYGQIHQFSSVTQLCPTLWDPMDSSLPGSSVHGIFQARIQEWGAISFSTYRFRILLLQLRQGYNSHIPNLSGYAFLTITE